MQFTELNAETRIQTGTGVARKLRREGFLPAVLYGKGHTVQVLKVNEKEVDKILKTKHGKNSLIHLTVKDGGDQKVMIKDYQGHVLTRRLLHVDFMIVKEDQKIIVNVPVRIEGKPVGLQQGGLLEVSTRVLELHCTVGHIPDEIVVDVSGLNVGQNLHLSDLKMPVGVTYKDKYNPPIASVNIPKKEEEPAPVVAAATPEGAAAAAANVPTSAQKAEGEKAPGGAAPAKQEAGKAAPKAAPKK